MLTASLRPHQQSVVPQQQGSPAHGGELRGELGAPMQATYDMLQPVRVHMSGAARCTARLAAVRSCYTCVGVWPSGLGVHVGEGCR